MRWGERRLLAGDILSAMLLYLAFFAFQGGSQVDRAGIGKPMHLQALKTRLKMCRWILASPTWTSHTL